MNTIGGHVEWGEPGVPKNVAKTPMVGGQWVKSDGKYEYDLVVVSNSDFPDVPKEGDLQPIPGS
jgi:branched-chain amino acid transport system substrate-binding protein